MLSSCCGEDFVQAVQWKKADIDQQVCFDPEAV